MDLIEKLKLHLSKGIASEPDVVMTVVPTSTACLSSVIGLLILTMGERRKLQERPRPLRNEVRFQF